MDDGIPEKARIEVWVAMADHFLDTETRQDIPRTALCCARAGLTTEEARTIWQYEVSPAVSFNGWDIAGEWACWDRDWLVERIQRVRKTKQGRPGALHWLCYRVSVHFLHPYWVSIERCLGALLELPSAAAREERCRDLTFLAQHYFDFAPAPLGTLEPSMQERVRRLYPEPFRTLMAPVRYGERDGDRRVRAALSVEGRR